MNFHLEDQQILEEDYDENYEPTEEEVFEYCKVLGLDPSTEKDFLYIAREGIKAPLPKDWKPVEDQSGNIYYFNFATGDSTWEHPCDEFYRKLLQQERDKNTPGDADSNMLPKGGKKKGITLKGNSRLPNGGYPSLNGGSSLVSGGGSGAPLGNGGPGTMNGAPLGNGGPGTMNGAPLRNGGPGTMNGAPLRNGGPGALNGGGPLRNGGPGALNGGGPLRNSGPGAMNGAPLRNGGPGAMNGAPLRNGGPGAMNGGAPLRNGGPGAMNGAPLRNGGPGAMNGAPLRNGGPGAMNGARLRDGGPGAMNGGPGAMNGARLRDGVDGERNGGGMSEENGLRRPGLGELPNMGGSPGHSKLAPLSLGGGKPLPSIGGLPPLKTPSSLAPLRPPPSMSQGSSLGGSLSSTGGSRLTDPLGSSLNRGEGGLGHFDLGSVRISTQFEEEDEDSDSESDSRGDGFRSKLGVNLLGAEDLGLKETEEDLDSTEDVSKELRKIMDISSDRDENSRSEHSLRGTHRPSDPISSRPAAQRMGGAGIGRDSPVSSPRPSRPGAARMRDKSNSNSQLPSPLHSGANSPSWQGNGRANGMTGGKGALSSPATVRLGEPTGLAPINSPNHMKSTQFEHDTALKKIKEDHTLELKQLKEELAEQFENIKANLTQENQTKVASLRDQLAREQIAEEKKIRAEKTSALNVLRVKVEEEREDEEARLEEEKQDYLRKMKQQLLNEKEREEKRLKDDNSKALSGLREQLENEQAKTESDIRSKAASELSNIKEKVHKEIEEEREDLKSTLEEELEGVRESQETELEERKSEIEREHQKQMDTLQKLREQHEKEMKSALAEIEESNSLDKVREDALKAHQDAEQEIQAEFAAALDRQKQELKEQHKREMEDLKAQLGEELNQTKTGWIEKSAREVQSLSQELERTRDSLKQEQEATLQSLLNEFQTAREELQQKSEQQSRELASLQSEHASKVKELHRLTQQVDQEQHQLESRRTLLQQEEDELKKEEERLLQMRSATAQEREQLLDSQQTELKAAIERQNKSLNELKGSYSTVENALHELQEQKNVIQASLEGLQENEAEVKGQFVLLKEKVQKERDSLHQLKREKKQIVKELHVHRGAKKPHRVEDRGEGVSDEEETAGSMEVGDLASPGGRTSPCVDSETEVVSSLEMEGVKDSLVDNQRELHNKLSREQKSLSHTKEFLNGQQKPLRHRRTVLKQAHRQLNRDQPNNKYEDSNLSLLKEIRAKLDQEAVVLNELEDKMRHSDKVLAQKEMMVGELQSTLKQELEEMSDEESEPASPGLDSVSIGIPSAKNYLTKLRASLERSKRYTQSKSSHIDSSSRNIHLSSPLPSHRPSSRRQKRTKFNSEENSSESDLGTSESSSTALDNFPKEERQFGRPRSFSHSPSTAKDISHFSPATRKIMEESLRARGALDMKHSKQTHQKSPSNEQSLIFDSLTMINSQLGKLLTRLPDNTTSGYSIPPPPVHPVEYGGAIPTTSHMSSSSNRWAEPVQRFDHTDLELHGKRQSYLGSHPNVVPPSMASSQQQYRSPAVRPQLSTEELMHSQTDWLKEFRQSVPLSSRQSLRSKPTLTAGSTLHSSHTTQAKASVLPSKPKLVLDNSNNVKLVRL